MRTKYTKPQTPDNNEFDDSETLDWEGSTNKDMTQHPTIGDAPHVVTDKEIETITKSTQLMADVFKAFTKMLCDDDGFLIDISDKKGRERDHQFMLSLQSRMDASMQRIEQDMQRHYTAELQPKDAQRFETLNRNFNITRYWMFGSCFLGAAFLILGLFLCAHASSEKDEMEEKYNELSSMADFGSYVSKRAPITFQAWQNATPERRDSVKNGLCPLSDSNNK